MNIQKNLKPILLMASNPRGTVSLRLQEEEREIRERLRLAGYGKVPIHSAGAVRVRDIQQAMLDFNPKIVHFTGHGEGVSGLIFENASGQAQLVDSKALASLFKLFSDQIECVVLNACYSKLQAKEISQHIDYVIGMDEAISDSAAIEFSVGFYTALGAGKSFQFAYELGCNAIQLEGLPEELVPAFLSKSKDLQSTEDISKTKYMVVLSTTIDELNKPLLEAMVEHLKKVSGDTSLTLQRIEPGSVKLILTGSKEGFDQILERFEEGYFSKLLGIDIESIVEVASKVTVPITPLAEREQRERSPSQDISNVEMELVSVLEMQFLKEILENGTGDDSNHWVEANLKKYPSAQIVQIQQQIEESFQQYLSECLSSIAVQWLELHLQGYSQDRIAQALDLSINQVYRLREKISYHAIRIFT
ncbi:MAG: CHAT domain-containing protein, partial [Cyanobacteria bacterium P01_F01_bin.116]